jgi:predicted ATPase
MISEWKLFNFKSVADETKLSFRPLTLFAGPNSSGKSTCIQSILLICQTLRNPIGSRPIILNGALARLGQFSDLKTTGSVANAIFVGWTLEPATMDRVPAGEMVASIDEDWLVHELEETQLRSIDCNVAFDAKVDVPSDPTQLNPQLFSTLLTVKTRDEEGLDHTFTLGVSRARDAGESKLVALKNVGTSEEEIERVRVASAFDVTADEDSSEELWRRRRFSTGDLVGCDLSHFLPGQIAISYNRSEENARLAARAVFNLGRPPFVRMARVGDVVLASAALRELMNTLQPVRKHLSTDEELLRVLAGDHPVSLPALLESFRALAPRPRREVMNCLQSDPQAAERFETAMKSESGNEYRTAFTGLPQSLQVSCDYMRRYFAQSIRYLGPLRDEPKALYPLAGSADPMDVGLKGENTAAVLDVHKNRLVRLLSPAAFAEPAITADPIYRTLKTAVTDWLKYLRVAENVESIDRGKLGHELKIRIDERSGDQDLTHVGVGVSQVLPILVMCLLADPDTVLLFEQPELHLHPRVQTLLGDFFLSMALLHKQCIIETHSEYLINRLRFRAAAAESDKVASQMTIYFVEKKEDKSQFRPIVVNEFGAIQDWPEGFFDQSQREAEETLKAAVKKKRHHSQTRKS